jgi:hypothetical protein
LGIAQSPTRRSSAGSGSTTSVSCLLIPIYQHGSTFRGFTQVVQFEADAQHEAAAVARFLEAARNFANALVLGRPLFDQSAPKSRVYGRRLSQGLVWLATLSREVRDPLRGFRCIALAPRSRSWTG